MIRKHAPDARVYRAFNSYAWEVFEGDGQTALEQLISEIGLHPVRVGDLDQAETVDNILALWASLAIFEGKGRASVAFTILER